VNVWLFNASVIWSAKRSGQPWLPDPGEIGDLLARRSAAAPRRWASVPAGRCNVGRPRSVLAGDQQRGRERRDQRSARNPGSQQPAFVTVGPFLVPGDGAERASSTEHLLRWSAARFDRHPTAGRRRATAAHKGGQTVSQVSRSRRSSVRVSSALSRGWSRSVSNFSMRLAVQWWRSTSRSQPRSAASVARACSTRRRARSRGA